MFYTQYFWKPNHGRNTNYDSKETETIMPTLQKIGLVIALIGLIIALYGSVANQEQSVEAGYSMLFAGIAGLICLLGGATLIILGKPKS